MAEEVQNPQPAQAPAQAPAQQPAQQPAEQPAQQQSSGGASKIWYLLPILLGIIGGVIAFVLLRNKDPKLGKNALILGVVLTVISVILLFTAFSLVLASIISLFG